MNKAKMLILNDFYKNAQNGLKYISNRGESVSRMKDLPENERVFVEYLLDSVKKLETILKERKNNAIQS